MAFTEVYIDMPNSSGKAQEAEEPLQRDTSKRKDIGCHVKSTEKYKFCKVVDYFMIYLS